MNKKLFFSFFFILICTSIWGVGEDEFFNEMTSKEPVKIKDDHYFRQLINGQNQFAFDLYQSLKAKRGNLLISSYNVAIAMNMVGLGALGQTAQEISQTLHYSINLYPLFYDLNQSLLANEATKSEIYIANALWVSQGLPFLPAFQISIKRSFVDGLQFANFTAPSQALNAINQWISQATKGKISQIVNAQELTKETQMLLTCGFFLKNEWELPFDRRASAREAFTYKNHPFQVEMMVQTANYLVLVDEQFDLVQIPFKGTGLNMTVFLPKKEKDLSVLEPGLNAQQWEQWMTKLQPLPVELHLPKFRIDSAFELKTILKGLGIRQAFEPEANFSGISEKAKVYLSGILHKTFLRINESGINGASATSIRDKVLLEKPVLLEINRPFFFTIQDRETGLILCLGRIVQP